MKVKTSEASGPVLDWMVAKCEGITAGWEYALHETICMVGSREYSPSTDWQIGGPIIEREGITLRNFIQGDAWDAQLDYDETFLESGPTPLIAAMRCYVASKLGEEVEVPDELD